MTRLWVLGALDPEMEAIESILTACGERWVGASDPKTGARVRPERAYSASREALGTLPDEVMFVECGLDRPLNGSRVVVVDHHRPGDPGYGRPPAEYWQASSIGQVLTLLGVGLLVSRLPPAPQPQWTLELDPVQMLMVAAADHCLGAAYRGECPGVDPGELMRWRAESRAAFQRRPVEAVLADVEATSVALREAHQILIWDRRCARHWGGDPTRGLVGDCTGPGGDYASDDEACRPIIARDMRRREPPWPELPEAACRAGEDYVSGPLVGPDGRRKYTCSGSPELVRAWLDGHVARALGLRLEDLYGDPARGFAGGYEAQMDRAPMAGVVPVEVHERGWRPIDKNTAFASPFGTIRQCRICGCLVAGGPTACARCAKAGA